MTKRIAQEVKEERVLAEYHLEVTRVRMTEARAVLSAEQEAAK